MSRFTDLHYLTADQYRDSTNLDARVEIHRRFSINPYGWFRWVFDKLEMLPQKTRILELGCGSGQIWRICVDRVPKGWVVTLSDLSQGMLDAAWRNLVVTGHAFKFEQIDAQSIPYDDETFDAVIANHMLYHIPDQPKAIAEIKRVLKPNGRLFATTVGDNHLKELNDWVERATHWDYRPFGIDLFTLENGFSRLEPFFQRVNLYRYEDSLRITEIKPLMAYIRSGIRLSDLSESIFVELERDLISQLKQEGALVVTKDSGLFEAIK